MLTIENIIFQIIFSIILIDINIVMLHMHFSWIDKVNYFLYPKLLLTSLKNIHGTVSNSKKWWHWVKTYDQSYSINFFDNKIFNEAREHIIIIILILKN